MPGAVGARQPSTLRAAAEIVGLLRGADAELFESAAAILGAVVVPKADAMSIELDRCIFCEWKTRWCRTSWGSLHDDA